MSWETILKNKKPSLFSLSIDLEKMIVAPKGVAELNKAIAELSDKLSK